MISISIFYMFIGGTQIMKASGTKKPQRQAQKLSCISSLKNLKSIKVIINQNTTLQILTIDIT